VTPPYPQQTISYKTFVKTTVTLGLREVFANHPDQNLRGVKVTLESPTTRAHYPAVVVKFFGRDIQNVGVGSIEFNSSNQLFEHYWYNGDISLEIHALDPRSADYISNTIVQTITLGNLQAWTDHFLQRTADLVESVNPDAAYNVVTINTDKISEFGESKEPATWQAEDAFIYRNSYRMSLMGEYYSIPATPEITSIIEHVNFYAYDSAAGEPVPTGTADPAPWLP
jgi:hypothetical protein